MGAPIAPKPKNNTATAAGRATGTGTGIGIGASELFASVSVVASGSEAAHFQQLLSTTRLSIVRGFVQLYVSVG